jgi:hypothetical protein
MQPYADNFVVDKQNQKHTHPPKQEHYLDLVPAEAEGSASADLQQRSGGGSGSRRSSETSAAGAGEAGFLDSGHVNSLKQF